MSWKCETNEKIISVSAKIEQGTSGEEERMSVTFTICNAFFSINYHNISCYGYFEVVDSATISLNL